VRYRSCWLTPVSGVANFDGRNADEKWQLLLYEDAEQGNIHLWMAAGQKIDSWLSPGPNNTIQFNYKPCEEITDAHLLIASTSNKHRFSRLIAIALEYFKNSIMEKKEDRKKGNEEGGMELDSIILEKLGYCTWNAFGKSVDALKVYDALDSLKSNEIPIGYVILDDGWQKVSKGNQQLISMEACEVKFPSGLKKTIFKLKTKYPFVQYVGVWHVRRRKRGYIKYYCTTLITIR
jgi:hypothetical protein